MTFNEIEIVLCEKFKSAEVSTRDVLKAITDMGESTHPHYGMLRNKYSVRHGTLQFCSPDAEVKIEETDAEVQDRINKRFAAMDKMVRATAKGINTSMIISGPAGVGKSYGVEQAVSQTIGDFTHIKGYIRPTGLYKQLYMNRHSGSTIVFDDADNLFSDETSMNILKCVCDSSETRRVSWLSNSVMETEDGESIPSSFDFSGNIIFITNKDFEQMIAKDNKMAPHLEAMISRCLYLDIGIKTTRDYISRIQYVINEGMLDDVIAYQHQQDLMHYLKVNSSSMRELSLRMVKKLANLITIDPKNWKELAKIVCQK